MNAFFLLAALSCSRDAMYGNASLTQSLEASFEDCDEKEIAFLARKQNIQTAFDNCGSNYFTHFRWSPSGLLLYFQLFQGAYILNGETQGITALPITRPTDNAIWMSEGQLIFPSRQEDENQPELINVYNAGGFIDSFPSPVKEPRHFQHGPNKDEIYLSGLDSDGTRQIYTLNIPSRSISPAFPFHTDGVDEFQFAKDSQLLTVTHQGHLWVYKEAKLFFTLEDIKRAVPHPDGRYIALEVDGKPIIPIEKDVLGSLDPEMQKREERRRQQKAEELPDWMPKEIIPPEVHIISLEQLKRYRMSFFYGEKITWYEAQRYYISFYLRGIETHMINSNVGLTDLSIPLYALDKGDSSGKAELVGSIQTAQASD